MRYFVVLFMGMLVFVHAYMFFSLRRAFRPGAWLWIALVILIAGIAPFFLRMQLRLRYDAPQLIRFSYIWIALLILMCILLLARDGAHLAGWMIDRLAGSHWFAWFGTRGSVRVALLLGLLGFFYALYEGTAIRVRTLTLPTALLPDSVERLRIVALSDIHIEVFTSIHAIEKMVALANSQQPDIIAVVGDFVDGQYASDSPQVQALAQLQAPLGKFAVLGNHELYAGYDASIRFIRDAGFTLLQGDAVEAGGIIIAGVDDPQRYGRRSIADTLSQIDNPDRFVFLMSHRPEAPENSLGRFDLEVAGHTHGGQIWPMRYFIKYLNHGFVQGINRLTAPPQRPRDESIVYVSNGTRYWGPPIRFLTPPEITVIDLVKAQ